MSPIHCRTDGDDVYCHFYFRHSSQDRKRQMKGEFTMPKTKLESFFFTFITAWMMVYCMTLYNMVLSAGEFTNFSFLFALKGMWREFIIIFFCAYLLSGRIAKRFAFRVVQLGDRPIFVIFFIQIFTVVAQVGFASILGVHLGYGFDRNFLPHYLLTYCKNFEMALPLQLFLVGPLARFVFRSIFLRGEKPKTLDEVQQVDEEILEKTV